MRLTKGFNSSPLLNVFDDFLKRALAFIYLKELKHLFSKPKLRGPASIKKIMGEGVKN